MKHCCYYSKSGRHDRGNWFLDYYLCAVDGVVTSRDCEEVACAKEDSCKGIHVLCRSSLDYNYAQKDVVDMYMYVTCGRAFFVVQRCMG